MSEQNKGDYVIRGIAADGQVLAFACDVTLSVEEARIRHQSTPVATAALGRTMAAAAMMSCELKDKSESITIHISGNGPLGKVIAIGDGGNRIRGYVQNPQVDLPLKEKGKLDVGRAVGIGVMNVIKDLGLKEPYVGSTHLVSSEIAEDLAYYFMESEQIPSAVSLGVLMTPEHTVWSAGGFILQLLPGATEETAALLEERVKKFPQISHFLAEGNTPEEALKTILEHMDYKTLGTVPYHFECDCSKKRVLNALLTLGPGELDKMIQEGKEVETVCNFCGQKYYVSVDELKVLKDLAADRQKRKQEKQEGTEEKSGQ